MLSELASGYRSSASHVQANGVLADLCRALDDPMRINEPRYLRLRAAILAVIAQGRLGAGDKLPSEIELAQATGLSRGTVQKALAHLSTEHVLVRRHGHGTFVAGGAEQSDQLIHFRFIGEDGAITTPIYAEAISRKRIRAKGPWSEFLSTSTNFIQIRRRMSVGGEFDCVSDFYLDGERFRAVLDLPLRDLHRTIIRQTLAVEFNAPTLFVTRSAGAARFPETIGKLLKLPDEDCFGLVLAVCSYTHNREPIAFQNIFVPSGARPLELASSRVS